MTKTTIVQLTVGLFIVPFLAACLALSPSPGRAQGLNYPEDPERYSRAELAQMLAPIALYPDALLAQVLMASTYPIEVIEADRWVKRHPQPTGAVLDAALLDVDWDPSVKALCHFPSLLALMSERIAETTELGNAFLAQEAEVMDMVQQLRASAYARGHLATSSRQTVIVERETILIVPANPRVVYVPYYDPLWVYGPWWYPARPPRYWGPRVVSLGVGLHYWPGFHFDLVFGSWSRFDWHRHTIFIEVKQRPRFVRHDRWLSQPDRWRHAPSHRHGVVYRDRSTAVRYGQVTHHTVDVRRNTRPAADRRTLDQSRRGPGRIERDRDRHREDRAKLGASRPLPPRLERERPQRPEAIRDRGDGKGAGHDRQLGRQPEPDRQPGQRIGLERQIRDRRQREGADSGRQIGREPSKRTDDDRARQDRQRSVRPKQVRKPVDQEPAPEKGGTLFSRMRENLKERQAGEGNRDDRQERAENDRGRQRREGDGRYGRDDRRRDRR